MKHLALILVLALAGITSVFAQRANATPTMLLGPADWRFERLPIPPGFARDIPWNGYEEARFSPGMFDTNSATYFTYALSIYIDGTTPIQVKELKEFLDKYFKGLSTMIGKRKGMNPDSAIFNAEVTARKGEAEPAGKFAVKMPFIDTFTDGRQIMLNVEIDVLPMPEAKKTQLILLLSPQANDAPIWKQLREIRASVKTP